MIKVKFEENKTKTLVKPQDMKKGCVYVCNDDDFPDFPNDVVFICNPYKNVIAFSVCGDQILDTNNLDYYQSLYREVDIEILVKEKA